MKLWQYLSIMAMLFFIHADHCADWPGAQSCNAGLAFALLVAALLDAIFSRNKK
jgi:hypothetical protein